MYIYFKKSCLSIHFQNVPVTIGWLKANAFSNIHNILVTLIRFQAPIGWLKAPAAANIPSILVTLLTSQREMSSLNSLRRTVADALYNNRSGKFDAYFSHSKFSSLLCGKT
jgi:hypothetical protein